MFTWRQCHISQYFFINQIWHTITYPYQNHSWGPQKIYSSSNVTELFLASPADIPTFGDWISDPSSYQYLFLLYTDKEATLSKICRLSNDSKLTTLHTYGNAISQYHQLTNHITYLSPKSHKYSTLNILRCYN